MIHLCRSIKSKNIPTLQCSHKPKENEIFCGLHLKSSKITLFKEEIEEEIDNVIINEPKILHLTKEELYEYIENNKYISIGQLRYSLKELKLDVFIKIKLSKSNMINELKKIMERERYFKTNKEWIIKCQSIIRGWIKRRRYNCINRNDILTYDSLFDIPSIYFYIFKNKDIQKSYGYDIRTLYEIIKNQNPICPYTCRPFTEDEKNTIFHYCAYLNKLNISLDIEKIEMNEEEKLEMKMKDVFHLFNMLDNYTSYTWFKNLNLNRLIDLYIYCEDIWNYRCNMSYENKNNIIHMGIAFNCHLSIIKRMIRDEKNKIILQNLLLDEFYRFATEGINREEKKLGVMLILSGLVLVSEEAFNALPHLAQIY